MVVSVSEDDEEEEKASSVSADACSIAVTNRINKKKINLCILVEETIELLDDDDGPLELLYISFVIIGWVVVVIKRYCRCCYLSLMVLEYVFDVSKTKG